MLAVHKLTQQEVAIKIIDKKQLDLAEYSRVQTEIRLLSMMRHTNIIRLYSVLETSLVIYMVMEHAKGGDLLRFMKQRHVLSQVEARRIFR